MNLVLPLFWPQVPLGAPAVTPEVEILDNDGALLLDNDGTQLIDNS